MLLKHIGALGRVSSSAAIGYHATSLRRTDWGYSSGVVVCALSAEWVGQGTALKNAALIDAVLKNTALIDMALIDMALIDTTIDITVLTSTALEESQN